MNSSESGKYEYNMISKEPFQMSLQCPLHGGQVEVRSPVRDQATSAQPLHGSPLSLRPLQLLLLPYQAAQPRPASSRSAAAAWAARQARNAQLQLPEGNPVYLAWGSSKPPPFVIRRPELSYRRQRTALAKAHSPQPRFSCPLWTLDTRLQSRRVSSW